MQVIMKPLLCIPFCISLITVCVCFDFVYFFCLCLSSSSSRLIIYSLNFTYEKVRRIFFKIIIVIQLQLYAFSPV